MYHLNWLWLAVLLCLLSVASLAEDHTLEQAPRGRVQVDKVFVQTVIIEGNTVFSAEALAPIIRPYQGRALSADDIRDLKDALTTYYISQGYINSGVVLEQHTVSDGVLRLRVIEGRLMALTINGNQRLRSGYIQQRVLPEFGAS